MPAVAPQRRPTRWGALLALLAAWATITPKAYGGPAGPRRAFARHYLHQVWIEEFDRRHEFLLGLFLSRPFHHAVERRWYYDQLRLLRLYRGVAAALGEKLRGGPELPAERIADIPPEERRSLALSADRLLANELSLATADTGGGIGGAVWYWFIGASFLYNADLRDTRSVSFGKILSAIAGLAYEQHRLETLGTHPLIDGAGLPLRRPDGWPLEAPASREIILEMRERTEAGVNALGGLLETLKTPGEELTANALLFGDLSWRLAMDVVIFWYAGPICRYLMSRVVQPAARLAVQDGVAPVANYLGATLGIDRLGARIALLLTERVGRGFWGRALLDLGAAEADDVTRLLAEHGIDPGAAVRGVPRARPVQALLEEVHAVARKLAPLPAAAAGNDGLLRRVGKIFLFDELVEDSILVVRAATNAGYHEEAWVSREACGALLGFPGSRAVKMEALEAALHGELRESRSAFSRGARQCASAIAAVFPH